MFEWVFSGFQQRIVRNGERFVARVYSGVEACIPEGFNVVRVCLDARERSLLCWDAAEKRAQQLIDWGYLILWDLHFDLLKGPLDDSFRLLTFELAVEHFTKHIFSKFQSSTFGVSLFQGSLEDLSRDDLYHTLRTLLVSLPDSISSFLIVDTSSITDPMRYFTLLQQDLYGYFHLILKGDYARHFPFTTPSLGWDHGATPWGYFSEVAQEVASEKSISTALCLPDNPTETKDFASVLEELRHQPLRILSEKTVVYAWDGIDELIVFSEHVNAKLRRKLLGFCAAQGRVLVVGEPIGLPSEIPWNHRVSKCLSIASA